MSTYHTLASFAQTWGFALIALVFLGGVLFALSPSRKAEFDAAAQMPLKED